MPQLQQMKQQINPNDIEEKKERERESENKKKKKEKIIKNSKFQI